MSDLSTYRWQVTYQEAVLETDQAKMPALINAAQKALQDRLAEIQVYSPEHQAIEEAKRALATLKAERVDPFEVQ